MDFSKVEDQYKKPGCPKKEDVLALMEWQALQPHLPKISEMQTALFLHSCYGSNEAAKQCIDNFFSCRTHCPEFFSGLDPLSKEVQLCLDTVSIATLSKLTPKGDVICYARLKDCNPDVYNFNAALKTFDMIGQLVLAQNGCINGEILVIDLEGCTLMHVLKCGVLSIKKYLYYLQEALPFRLKGFHYVNGVSFMDKILALVKPFMKKELQDMLHCHFGNNETIFKFIPKDCLPIECGGDGCSILEEAEKCRKNIEANRQFHLDFEKLMVDESKRPGKPKDAGDLFGVEGTFKKLDID